MHLCLMGCENVGSQSSPGFVWLHCPVIHHYVGTKTEHDPHAFDCRIISQANSFCIAMCFWSFCPTLLPCISTLSYFVVVLCHTLLDNVSNIILLTVVTTSKNIGLQNIATKSEKKISVKHFFFLIKVLRVIR